MAFEDLSKNYKAIYRKISNLLKEEKECQVRFKDWESRCKKLITEAEAKKTLEERVSFYYGGPLEECSDG